MPINPSQLGPSNQEVAPCNPRKTSNLPMKFHLEHPTMLSSKALGLSLLAEKFFAMLGYVLVNILTAGLFFATDYIVSTLKTPATSAAPMLVAVPEHDDAQESIKLIQTPKSLPDLRGTQLDMYNELEIESAKLIQTPKYLPDLRGAQLEIYKELEIESARLLKKFDQAQGISQVNFADEELNIKRGQANYCCGSMSVAALLDRMGGNKKKIEELLKEGVVRHLKLPPKQMFTLTTVKMLVDVNPEITEKPFIQEDKESKRNMSIDRYKQFLGTIAPGSSGLLLAKTAFIMYVSNVDGSVEIFDSHGSSIPLIVGDTQPAYRALFQNINDAAAYLSVHRNLVPDCVLDFYPLDVTTCHETILAQ